MFDSSVIDVGIGLVFVYLLLSTAVTAAKEGMEAIFKQRGKNLEKGIKELVGYVKSRSGDTKTESAKQGLAQLAAPKSPELTFVGLLYDHPLINSLFAGKYSDNSKGNLPSYIPSKNFALALYDLYKQGSADGSKIVLPDKIRKAFDAFRITAEDDKDKTLTQIEDWYNSSMDRVSGWYKRRTQWWILGIAVVITTAVNADSVLIAKRLSSDKTLREAAVKAAQSESARNATKDSPGPAASTGSQSADAASSTDKSIDTIKTNLADLDGVGLPIGWQAEIDQRKKDKEEYDKNKAASVPDKQNPTTSSLFWQRMLMRLPGWIITILAISLGAPFWFDVLNKFMVVRSTVKPHEKSKEEKSKDGGSSGAAVAPGH